MASRWWARIAVRSSRARSSGGRWGCGSWERKSGRRAVAAAVLAGVLSAGERAGRDWDVVAPVEGREASAFVEVVWL
jgi:hypothetical protein